MALNVLKQEAVNDGRNYQPLVSNGAINSGLSASLLGTTAQPTAIDIVDGVAQQKQDIANMKTAVTSTPAGTGTAKKSASAAMPKGAKADTWQSGYAPSEAVNNALAYLQQQEAAVSGIGPYNGSPYDQDIADAYSKIMGRGPFSYNVNADALYQQYRDLYSENARQASLNAQGQAAGLTGGYGNSYAASAGNAAYDQQMTQLNDRALDLYDRAYQRWLDEGTQAENRLATARSMGEQDYSRWQDAYDRALQERQYAYGKYGDEFSRDYGMYQDTQSQAYNLVMAMIQSGIAPSYQLLRNAGISDTDYNTLSKYYKSKKKGKSSGGTQKTGLDSVADYLNGMVNSGKMNEETANYLYRMAAGVDTYTPSGSTAGTTTTASNTGMARAVSDYTKNITDKTYDKKKNG